MTAAAAPDTRLVCAHCVVEMSPPGTTVYVHGPHQEDQVVRGTADQRIEAARRYADSGYRLSTSLAGLLGLYAVTTIAGTALCARHAELYWGVAADRVRDMQWETARARRRFMG